MREVVTVARQGERWSVGGKYLAGGKQVGAYAGKDVQFADGKLAYTLVYETKPKLGWLDDARCTLSRVGERVEFHWQVGRSSGSRSLAATSTAADAMQPRVAAKQGPAKTKPAQGANKAKPATAAKKPATAAPAESPAEPRTKRTITTTDPRKRAIIPGNEPKEPTPIALPPAAKVGERMRFVMIPLGTTPLATIDDMKDGKFSEIATQMAIAYASGVEMSLVLSKVSEQPSSLDLKPGKYYCVTTFVRKEKGELPGPLLYAAQPLPEGKLVEVKLLGKAVGDYQIHIGPRTSEELWVFEARVAK